MMQVKPMNLYSQYLEILSKWNARFKLVGKHIDVQKLRMQAALMRDFANNHNITLEFVLDVGSGAGVPGIFWAMEHDSLVHFVEISANRASFLRFVLSELNLPGFVHHRDVHKLQITDLALHPSLLQLAITAHAFATVHQLLCNVQQFFSVNPVIVLLKSMAVFAELEVANKYFSFQAKTKVCDAGVLVLLTNLARR